MTALDSLESEPRIRMPTRRESSSLESSAQVIASNDDLLSELLLHLPIKSLSKCKSVCKHWLSLITDPHFTRRLKLKPNPVSALYLLCRSPVASPYYAFVPLDPLLQTRATFKSFTFVEHPRGIDVIHSCNGLLCCCSVGECEYYVHNPTTKQFTTLPPLCDQAAMQVLGVNLAFDPSISHVYKVVCIQRSKPNDHCRILIYSSETRRWRVSGAPFVAPISLEFQSGVYWNGAIHWVNRWGASLYFDLDKELVLEMPMPPLPDDYDEGFRYFGECGGHLHLVEIYSSYMTHFPVYEMERDHSGWFVKFQVDLNGFTRSHLDIYQLDFDSNVPSVLCVVRGDKEEDSSLVLHAHGNIIRYNFKTQTHQVIRNIDSLRIFGWPFVFQYIETYSPV